MAADRRDGMHDAALATSDAALADEGPGAFELVATTDGALTEAD
jgi:hypothetical protein